MVPSLAGFTPAPAFAFFAPFGNRTSGQILTHCAVQGVALAFNVYSAVPLTRIVPNVEFVEVEMTIVFVLCLVAALAALATMTHEKSPLPTTTAATAREEKNRIVVLPCRCIGSCPARLVVSGDTGQVGEWITEIGIDVA